MVKQGMDRASWNSAVRSSHMPLLAGPVIPRMNGPGPQASPSHQPNSSHPTSTGSVESNPKNVVNVIEDLCKGCELCVHACPSQNLSMSPGLNAKGYHPAVFSYEGKKGPCTACGICYWICPDLAISEIMRKKQ